MNSPVSLFIPYVFVNITEEFMKNVFQEFGSVNRIDFVAKEDKNGKMYNTAYIHYDKWTMCAKSQTLLENIAANCGRVYYNDQFYWIVLKNTATKHIPGSRKQRIHIGEDTKETNELYNISLPGWNIAPCMVTIAPCLPTPSLQDLVAEHAASPWWKDLDAQESEDARNMSELEDEMDEANKHMITIDGRYVKTLEERVKTLEERHDFMKRHGNYMDKSYHTLETKYDKLIDRMKELKKDNNCETERVKTLENTLETFKYF